MNTDAAVNWLYDHYLPFRLYADHEHGLSIEELALLCSKPPLWVEERIAAVRWCVTKQIRIALKPATCSDQIWQQQIWD